MDGQINPLGFFVGINQSFLSFSCFHSLGYFFHVEFNLIFLENMLSWVLLLLLVKRTSTRGPVASDHHRLVGGFPVTANSPHSRDFPYHVQVGLYDVERRQPASLCGGALITPRWGEQHF